MGVVVEIVGALFLVTTSLPLLALGRQSAKSHSITLTMGGEGRPPPAAHSRVRRSLSAADQTILLNEHNRLRKLEGSSNMQKMVWNSYLASMAEEWSAGCNWGHGQPYRDPATMPYSSLGQNLWISNAAFSAAVGVQDWYNETVFYNYDTGACTNPPCGHYTQVVWANSYEVGCGKAFCSTVANLGFGNAHYLTCNYGPPGNYVGQKPFKKGSACTQCDSGQMYCDDGLCRRNCTSQMTQCECRANCANCGTVRTNCKCSCAPGWTGADCSAVCEDTHANCGANPGWPTSWCESSHQYVLDSCPLLCGLCTASTGSATTCPTTTPIIPTTTTSTSTTTPITTTTTTATPPTTTTPPGGGGGVDSGSSNIGQRAGFVFALIFLFIYCVYL